MAKEIGFEQEIEEWETVSRRMPYIRPEVFRFNKEQYVIADDSGLVGRRWCSGIYSARFGSTAERLSAERNEYLLEIMKDSLQEKERTFSLQHCTDFA